MLPADFASSADLHRPNLLPPSFVVKNGSNTKEASRSVTDPVSGNDRAVLGAD
jgi:hypothetical protein